MPAISVNSVTLTTATPTRYRRTNLRNRYAARIGSRGDRLVIEIAAQVVSERGRIGVPLGGRLLQRLGEDVVEVAAQRARQFVRRGRACSRNDCKVGVLDASGRVGWPSRLGFDHGAQPIDLRGGRLGGRMAAGQQQIQQHAERVHIGGRGHIALRDLLRGGEVRRERAPRELRQLRR